MATRADTGTDLTPLACALDRSLLPFPLGDGSDATTVATAPDIVGIGPSTAAVELDLTLLLWALDLTLPLGPLA